MWLFPGPDPYIINLVPSLNDVSLPGRFPEAQVPERRSASDCLCTVRLVRYLTMTMQLCSMS